MREARRFAIYALGIGIMIAVLNFIAGVHFLYWHYWWVDIPMHFLGGIFAAVFAFAVASAAGIWHPAKSHWRLLVIALLGTLAIGLLWEGYELAIDMTWNAIGNYQLDTTKDILFDLFGGYVAYVIVRENKLPSFAFS